MIDFEPINRLNSSIDKFIKDQYGVNEFHSSIESIIYSINESSLSVLREKLMKFESELEFIDFMVDEIRRSDSYKVKIEDLLNWMKESGFSSK
ncbi:hypothetical protein [Cognataquiflexum aquatile]|uniref:hypothetical protein n=1 Tax=Cognataquiflexum aquatile TaxID=2249427 RepID=UPI000DE950BC|nr:hypothetical protein [Cognataquiflexum aquatile]